MPLALGGVYKAKVRVGGVRVRVVGVRVRVRVRVVWFRVRWLRFSTVL